MRWSTPIRWARRSITAFSRSMSCPPGGPSSDVIVISARRLLATSRAASDEQGVDVPVAAPDLKQQLLQRRAQQPRDLHLRDADPGADLPLGQVLVEAQAERLLLLAAQADALGGDRRLGALERQVLVAERLDERHGFVVLA